MNFLFTIGAFLIVLSIIVFVHELGHFLVAKRLGIKVEEFAFGFPPRLWGRKKGETMYAINAIPFGGYVKMLGESGKRSKKEGKRSFANRTTWERAQVMVAGVFMNLLLAWVILSVGFAVGIEPFFTNVDDIFEGVKSGMINLEEGIKVKAVEEGGVAEALGFEAGDSLVGFNGEEIDSLEDISAVMAQPVGKFEVARDGEVLTAEFSEEDYQGYLGIHAMTGEKIDESDIFGAEFYDVGYFPRVKIFSTYRPGLRAGDIILAINGEKILFVEDYKNLMNGSSDTVLTVYRDGRQEEVLIEAVYESGQWGGVVVSGVIDEMPASMVGIVDGDLILSVNGVKVQKPDDFIGYVAEHSEEVLAVVVLHGEEEVFYEIKPVDGYIGVYLAEIFSGGEKGISVYATDQVVSQISVEKESYPFYEAPFVAFSELWRMVKGTGPVFVGIAKQIFGEGEVPAQVSGPVGIAVMSGKMAREGLMSFFRFIALLSISLAVLNILPMPPLDGGRLLFLFVEGIVGSRLSRKVEAVFQTVGVLLILGLILMITYKDILGLF